MKKKGFTLIELLVVIVAIPVIVGLVIAGPIGYILNIIALTECDFQPSYKAEVLHFVGIVVAPVGMIVGWWGVEDVVEDIE